MKILSTSKHILVINGKIGFRVQMIVIYAIKMKERNFYINHVFTFQRVT